MIFHVCSHFGDIELLPSGATGHTLVRWMRLTPIEKQALGALVTECLGPLAISPLTYAEGSVTLPFSLLEIAARLGLKLHPNATLITAVKFADASIKVSRDVHWIKRIFGGGTETIAGVPKHMPLLVGQPAIPQAPPPTAAPRPVATFPAPEAVAGVQVTMPIRGCPLPEVTEMKERKAADVVRKFLTGAQATDFDHHRAFVAIGGHTGHMYRVTSRWNADCEKYGVLRDTTRGLSICASNLTVPPSEEVLAMKFAVENYEREFLDSSHGAELARQQREH